ncbi:expressed unknown protein [Seminavis robusta]|uniref:Uncharacterized protein n=1 Tax=Seminavis robusta TaxID=568900 RepID=A0A9N8HNE0_9STRA|nr:expressed unknown protein [Seminavis robusta]|eukprot:Sro813_g206180.1 n/a (437) ;mRNA; r:18622-19932
MLDDMTLHFESNTYPDSLYEEFSNCMAKWGVERLEETQDVAFQAFYDTYLAGGIADDAWGNRQDNFVESRLNKSAIFGTAYRTYEIQEPCNYASNIAFHRSAVRVCDRKTWSLPVSDQIALMQTFVTTGTSSAWFHGSLTDVGRQFDGFLVSHLINTGYQLAIRGTSANTTILLTVTEDLEPTPFAQISRDLAYMPLNFSVSEWESYMNTLPLLRRYNRVAVALMTVACAGFFPFSICECLVVDVVAPVFLDENDLDFILNKYVPELKVLIETDDLPLGLSEGGALCIRMLGAVLGVLWAFLFQENQLPIPGLEGEVFNLTALGAIKSPAVDVLLYLIHGVKNSDKRGWLGPDRRSHPYPGAEFCNKDSPHALYHGLIADGMFELYAVVDQVEEVLTKRNNRRRRMTESRSLEEEVQDMSTLHGLRGKNEADFLSF